jgi:phospholipid/cholesterol/gamma-HCH transport system substrate-binding protein
MSSMAGDRQQIVDAINAGSTLATTMTQLLGGMEPALTHDVGSVNTLAGTLANNANGINTVLNGAPDFLTHLLRTTDYGSWVNVYLCNLSISLGGQPIDLGVGPHSEVCQ